MKTIGEYELRDFDLEYLRRLVSAPDSDPYLLDYYELDEEQVDILKEKYDFEFKPDVYAYVLYCYWQRKEVD